MFKILVTVFFATANGAHTESSVLEFSSKEQANIAFKNLRQTAEVLASSFRDSRSMSITQLY